MGWQEIWGTESNAELTLDRDANQGVYAVMYWRSHPGEGRGNEDRTRLLALALALALAQVTRPVPVPVCFKSGYRMRQVRSFQREI